MNVASGGQQCTEAPGRIQIRDGPLILSMQCSQQLAGEFACEINIQEPTEVS